MIDIHCHLLPQIDDGPKSWEIAIEMCRMAAEDGIEHSVATPHANDRYAYDRESFLELLQQLRERAARSPRLSLGCDFHLSYENLQDALIHPERFTIEGTRYLLVELSNYGIPVQMDQYFTRLLGIGVTPILTHPERNPILQEAPERVLQWVSLGCAVQVTGSSLTGFCGERAWRTAQWLLKKNAVHVLATDAHETSRRVPILSSARREAELISGIDTAEMLVDGNPRAIVSG